MVSFFPLLSCESPVSVKETLIEKKSVVTMKENVLPNSLGLDLPPTSKEDINKTV